MNLMFRKIASLRSWISGRSTREQLLLGLILITAFVWLAFEVVGSLGRTITSYQVASSEYDNQQLWIDQETLIDQRLNQALGNLESSKTFSVNQLLEVMDTISKKVGLQSSISRPSTREGKVFTEHVLLVPVARTSMRVLIDFENAIKEYYPYVGIDYLMIEPEPSAAGLFRGEIRITSFELNS